MVAAASIDGVWRAAPPRYSAADACEIAAHTFGVRAAAAQSLGSERDQAFTLRDAAGVDVAVMKISNAAEDVAVLDMEAMAASHAARIDSTLCVAIPRRRPGATASTDGASGGEAGHRAQWRDGEDTHWVRMYDRLPGRSRVDPLALSDAALTAWGETTARLGRALRGFIHPRAIRRVPWDVQYAAESRALLDTVRDRSTRSAVTAVLDRFEQVALPAWPTLRAQVVHGDLTVDNVLVDDAGLITGIIDFGDMSHTALLTDVASVLDSVVSGRTGDEGLRAARLVLDGYQRVTPLEADELRLVVDVWAARAAIGIAIASWRSAAGLEEPAFAERYNQSALALVEQVLSTGWEHTARLLGGTELGPDQTHAPTALAERRAAVLGPAMEPLSYADPIELHSASGVWMTDATGRRYLDMYNNVACVGHAHPRVVSAVTRQWRTLNTNLRYLHHAAIELAERLVATGPESLDTVLFVNSGSEANDLAWRLAVHHTGRSAACARPTPTTASPPRPRSSRRRPCRPTGTRATSNDGPHQTPTEARTSAPKGSSRLSAGSPTRGSSRPPPSWTPSCSATACTTSSRRTPRSCSLSPMRRARCGSPTRCRAVTAVPAMPCGPTSAWQ
jgi:Ser/Thr protein kinase RdoA (MazF antagonist)